MNVKPQASSSTAHWGFCLPRGFLGSHANYAVFLTSKTYVFILPCHRQIPRTKKWTSRTHLGKKNLFKKFPYNPDIPDCRTRS